MKKLLGILTILTIACLAYSLLAAPPSPGTRRPVRVMPPTSFPSMKLKKPACPVGWDYVRIGPDSQCAEIIENSDKFPKPRIVKFSYMCREKLNFPPDSACHGGVIERVATNQYNCMSTEPPSDTSCLERFDRTDEWNDEERWYDSKRFDYGFTCTGMNNQMCQLDGSTVAGSFASKAGDKVIANACCAIYEAQ